MADAKNINYFSVADVDLREVAGSESQVFSNDDITIILNGSPFYSPYLHEGQIYQLPESRVLLVVSGEADVLLDLEQHHFHAGTVVATSHDVILEIEHCSADIKICGFTVSDHHLIDETLVVNTKPKDSQLLLRMLYLLWDIAHEEPFRSDCLKKMVAAILSNVGYLKQKSDRLDSTTNSSRNEQLFLQFKRLVNKHCDTQRNIPFYAAQLHLSPHHFSTVIGHTSGHSVMYWINRAALLRAKLLLATTDLMAYEIAERLHFPNSPAFTSFFKRESGFTPKAYRQLFLKNAI